MGTFNLGAVLFALLLLVWLAYAVPRIAERRDVIGQTRPIDLSRNTGASRDLTAAAHHRRRSPEVHAAMPDNRLLSRHLDPHGRPRSAEPAPGLPGREVAADRSRDGRRTVLVALVAVTAIALVLALVRALPWYLPLLSLAVVAGFVIVLRRAELVRRARVRGESTARHQESGSTRVSVEQGATRAVSDASSDSGEQASLDAAPAPVTMRDPHEWTPRPVPRPTYSLRGDVDDLQTRHLEHRASVLGTPLGYEREDLEAHEATREQVEGLAPAVDLNLDEVLARRRGA